MKKIFLLALFSISLISNAQSTIQSVNSGSIITSNSSVSIGEIVVVPVQNQSNSGIIGILSQVNQQLETSQFELSKDIVAYPNPTIAKIFFKTEENLSNESVSVYNNAGQLVLQSKINNENSLDLNELTNGIYMIQFSNKKLNTFKIIKR